MKIEDWGGSQMRCFCFRSHHYHSAQALGLLYRLEKVAPSRKGGVEHTPQPQGHSAFSTPSFREQK